MRLVTITEAAQNLNGVCNIRCFNLDGCKATLKRSILFNMLAVLIKGCRADRLQLTTGEHRLQDARGVNRAFGGSGAHEGVHFVNKQDDVAAGANFFEHLLQALLEITAITRAGNKCAEVKGVNLLIGQSLGDLTLDDVLGQAFNDGGLANTGLTDQHRIVLGAAR